MPVMYLINREEETAIRFWSDDPEKLYENALKDAGYTRCNEDDFDKVRYKVILEEHGK